MKLMILHIPTLFGTDERLTCQLLNVHRINEVRWTNTYS